MKILVTGSSGFIGTNLLELLLKEPHEVLGLDVKAPYLKHHHQFFKACNLLDGDLLTKTVQGYRPDMIVHLAARTDLDEKHDLQGYAVNVEGVGNLIQSIEAAGTVSRCIFTSTQLVCRTGFIPENENVYCPDTLYGKSKELGEKLVRDRDGGHVQWCLVRPTTIWGPGMLPHYHRLFRMIAKGRYFHVGHKPLFKSYGFVGNSAHQLLKLLEAPAELVHQQTYYLADYEPLSLRAWTEAIRLELGAPPIKTLPQSVAKAAAKFGDLINMFVFPGYPFNSFRLKNVLSEYIFDLSKLQNVCGPLPYSMHQGVKETVAWLKAKMDIVQK